MSSKSKNWWNGHKTTTNKPNKAKWQKLLKQPTKKSDSFLFQIHRNIERAGA